MKVNPKSLLNLKKIKKGQVLNPNGNSKHSRALAAVRNLSNDEVTKVGTMLLDQNLESLKEIMRNPNSSALQVLITSVVVKAISKGDASALNVILDRVAGKVKEKLQVTGNMASNVAVVISLPQNGRETKE